MTALRLGNQSKYWRYLPYVIAVALLLLWLVPLAAEKPLNQIIQRTISGLLLGGIYATIALGIVVVNKASGVFNFAHGGLMMVVGFIFLSFFATSSFVISPVAALLLALGAVVMAFSTTSWRALLKPLNLLAAILVTLLLTVAMTIGASTDARLDDVTLSEAGTYSVVVALADETAESGGFVLNITQTVTDDEGQSDTLSPATTRGSFDADNTTQTVEFEAAAGDMVTLSATSTNADVTLTLLNPDGDEIAFNDDRAGNYAFLSNAAPGLYKGLAGMSDTLSWVRAIVGALTGAVLFGLLIERFTIRPLIGQPIFAAVMVTLALAEILNGVTKLIWGAQPQSLLIFATENAFIPGTLNRMGAITIQAPALGGNILIDQPRLFAFIVSLIAFAGFFVLFRFTNIGLAMRATSENQQLAESVGLRVRVILAVTWAIASVLAGIAGVLYAGSSGTAAIDTNLQYIALRAFPAVLLGGLESITGALIGGLLLGLTEDWAKMLFSGDVAENLAPYVVLMVVLVLRPEGLFGEKRIERI